MKDWNNFEEIQDDIEEMLDSDEISSEEAAFMIGYYSE